MRHSHIPDNLFDFAYYGIAVSARRRFTSAAVVRVGGDYGA